MNKVKLVDICTPKQWKTIPTSELLNKGYPVYGANGIIGYYDKYNHENSVVAITCRGATCGSVHITVPNAYITGNAMCLDDLREDIEPYYLYYCLLHFDFQSVISGSAQPQITRQGLEKVLIPICSRERQVSIANRLKKTENIIAKRKEELAKLDILVKSRFIEMFGDLESNTKGWKKVTFDEVSEKITDGEHAPVPRVDKGYVFLNARNVLKSGEIDLRGVTFISEDNHNRIYKRCNPEPGDILLTTTGTIGNVAIVPKIDAFSMDRGITLIKQDRSVINGTFFAVAMQMDSLQMHMKNGIHASAIGHLFMNKVKALPIYLPPITLQNQFADFVAQVDKSKSVLQKLLEKQELLRAALMQEYFG